MSYMRLKHSEVKPWLSAICDQQCHVSVYSLCFLQFNLPANFYFLNPEINRLRMDRYSNLTD